MQRQEEDENYKVEPLTEEEVRKQLEKLKKKKRQHGKDGITDGMAKDT